MVSLLEIFTSNVGPVKGLLIVRNWPCVKDGCFNLLPSRFRVADGP